MLSRKLEHWLHQHIFKVGWLATKNLQTTTILFYTFFLPGVFIYEVSYWLVAGVLNVHAKRSIRWPEKQDIAELKLNFVELAKDTSQFRLALITLAPLATGFFLVWAISNSILDIAGFLEIISTGRLNDISHGISYLTSAPDFWLWIYLLFTISNTMTPNLKHLRGLKIVLYVIAAITAVLIVIGVGNEVVMTMLLGPIAEALNLVAGTLSIIILIDLFFLVALGTIEAIIERFTGYSATFERGKLVALTRQQLLERKQTQAQRALKAPKKQPSITSIYELELPIPAGPDKEPPTPVSKVLPLIDEAPAKPAPTLEDSRRGPDMISTPGTTSSSPSPARIYTPPTPALISGDEDSPSTPQAKDHSDTDESPSDTGEDDSA